MTTPKPPQPCIGERVTIRIDDHSAWTVGHMNAFEGLGGVVVEFSETSTNGSPFPGPTWLVEFDAPPPDPSPMAPRGRRVTAFWFASRDLVFGQPGQLTLGAIVDRDRSKQP